MILRFFAINAGDLVFRAFAIAALTFGATSLYGYVTKRDLTGFSSFFVMGSIGLLIAIVVNALFFKSTMMSFITSSLWSCCSPASPPGARRSGDVMRTTARRPEVEGDLRFLLYSNQTLFVHILNLLGIMRSNDNRPREI
jgi:hypothetical protein